jgi:hypothetical protein
MAQKTKRKMTEEEEVIAFLEESFHEVTPEMVAKDPLLQKMVEEFEQELLQHGSNSKVRRSSSYRR